MVELSLGYRQTSYLNFPTMTNNLLRRTTMEHHVNENGYEGLIFPATGDLPVNSVLFQHRGLQALYPEWSWHTIRH